MSLDWIPDPNWQTASGRTTEGYGFEVDLHYEPGVPDGTQPVRVDVFYQASDDVPGDDRNAHIIERQPDGT